MEEQSSENKVHEPASQMEWFFGAQADAKPITPLSDPPFMGLGSTAIACKMLGRHYIGYEINPSYCIEARSRIDAAKSADLSALFEDAEWDSYDLGPRLKRMVWKLRSSAAWRVSSSVRTGGHSHFKRPGFSIRALTQKAQPTMAYMRGDYYF